MPAHRALRLACPWRADRHRRPPAATPYAGRDGVKITGRRRGSAQRHGADYRVAGAEEPETRSHRSPPGGAASVARAVHRGWRWVQEAGAVTAEHPGRLRFRRIGTGTRLAFPQGTVFGEPWIELGDHCIIGEQVTLTAGMMPGLDLGPGPDPDPRQRRRARPRQPCHRRHARVTIGSDDATAARTSTSPPPTTATTTRTSRSASSGRAPSRSRSAPAAGWAPAR